MKLDEKSLRIGAITLFLAVVLRLCIPFLPEDISFTSALFFLGSGKWITAVEPEGEQISPSPQTPADLPENMAVFSPGQAASVNLNNPNGYNMDAESLLLRELNWNLQSSAPRVLIVHSHTTESYENTEEYEALPNYRTLDPHYNMLAVGDRLAAILEEAGIGVLHDRTLHDHPSYNGAYASSKAAIQAYLEQYPDICLVLDLHRDAYTDSSGKQMGYTVSHQGQKVAKMMVVVSAFDGSAANPRWHENMALALKLQVQLESLCNGITRPIQVRSSNYNQSLGPRTLLIEMGAAGNTQQEALGATDLLAQGIIALALGAKPATLA